MLILNSKYVMVLKRISGEESKEMYVLTSGQLAVKKDGKLVGTVIPGSCVGEIGFMNGSLRLASIVACEKVVMYKLLKIEYDKVRWKKDLFATLTTKKDQVQFELEKRGINPTNVYAGIYAKKKKVGELINQRRFVWIDAETKRLFWAKSAEDKMNPTRRKSIFLPSTTVSFESPLDKTRCIELAHGEDRIIVKIPGPKSDNYRKDADVNAWFQVIMILKTAGSNSRPDIGRDDLQPQDCTNAAESSNFSGMLSMSNMRSRTGVSSKGLVCGVDLDTEDAATSSPSTGCKIQ